LDASTAAQAGALGVSPAQYNLAKRTCELDDTLAIEDAVVLTPVELMARIKTMKQENKDVSQALKDEFQVARELIKDEYQPQIEALEAQIAVLEGEGGDTAALEAELATLLEAFHAELDLLRTTYHTDSVELQTQTRTEYNARVSEHAAAVEAWRTQTETRKSELEDAINAYQHGTENTGTVTTNLNTSGTATTYENTSGTGGN
jgi:vacuolar-type H+-ATPase subunit I/STV1